MKLKSFAPVAAACVAGALGVALNANAQTAPDQTPPAAPAPAAAPSTAISLPYGISVTGHVEVGATVNGDGPANNINFGQTFTDQADTVRMNQALLNVERDLDPKNADYQWGFKFTGLFGTDARVIHFMNEFDRSISGPYQFSVVELDGQAHLPTFGGGTDLKIGQYPTPLGAEVIDATGNTFYSHSYIFNYGLPFVHTGALTTTHVNDTLDVWLGLDTGVNDSVGETGMANNYLPKFLFGIGLNNLMGGNLTILALSHMGPENPHFVEPNPPPFGAGGPPAFLAGANSSFREYYDVVTTYKINDSLTTTNELNLVHDDLYNATAGGAAQYFVYTLTDQWSLGARIEAFADQGKASAAPLGNGFAGFACDATEPLDYANGQRGLAPNLSYCGSGANYNVTYGEITLGATYKPSISYPVNVMIRPEIRWDTVVGGSGGIKPFDASSTATGTQTSQFTAAVDLIVGF